MKKISFILLIMVLCVGTGCSRDDEPTIITEEVVKEEVQDKKDEDKPEEKQQEPEQKDEYFIRYTASYSRGVGKTVYRNEKGKLITVTSVNFEIVIGPVEKGFEAFLGGSNPSAIVRNSRKIEVSKNGGVFMTKATGAYDLTYKIDF